MPKIEIDVDIDEVFSAMKPSEREEFIYDNLSEAATEDLISHLEDNNYHVFEDDDEIIEYLESKGYNIVDDDQVEF